MPRTSRNESSRVPKGKVALVVLIAALGAGIWEYLSDKLGGGWGLGSGQGDGNSGKGTKEPDKEPKLEDPAPQPKECEFRVQHDTVYHGKTALTVDEFIERARKCAEAGKIVDIWFDRPYTEGFFFDLERELEGALVSWRPHYETK